MKRKDKIGLVASIIGLFIIIFVVSALKDDRILSQATSTAIIVIAAAAVVAYCVYVLYKHGAAKKKGKTRHLNRYGATMSATLRHLDGLPLAKNLPVEVLYCPDRIVFKKDAQEITVSMDKVTGIDMVTGEGAVRKALAGAATGKYVAGGTAGAAVGALASITTLLIISYASDGRNKSITLDASGGGTFPSKAVKEFQKNHRQQTNKIEL